jgi:hypothetical protein
MNTRLSKLTDVLITFDLHVNCVWSFDQNAADPIAYQNFVRGSYLQLPLTLT